MCTQEARKAVLMGRTGSGKSTLANMLVQGSLDEPQLAPVGHGLRGTTVECKVVSGRGWTVIDTVGMGEAACGAVPDQDARQKVVSFLDYVKGRYTHLIFVIEKGRLDRLNTVIWRTFVDVFQGGEKHFIVLYTKADQPWMDSQMQEIKREFPECCNFACVDFPAPSKDAEDEADLAELRADELRRLEEELDRLVPPNTWVTPNITLMNNAETIEKAESILRKIARLIKGLVQDDTVARLIKGFVKDDTVELWLKSVSIIVNVLDVLSKFS